MLDNFDFLELSELLDQVLAAQEDLPESPYFLQRSLEFPYNEGAVFVGILNQMGGFAAVDAVFNELPRSTEQVLHPEKYFDKEPPVELDIPDDAMGAGWSVQAENVLGEFFLRTWLEALGSDSAAAAAAGWGGDAYAVFDNGSGDFALGVLTDWDTDEDAREFIVAVAAAMAESEDYSPQGSGLPGILEAWEGPGGHIVLSRFDSGDLGETVGIAITPHSDDSRGLIQALSAG